jgi:heterodisulfide reductase subunit B
MAFDDPESPTILEDFICSLGATPVVYPYRNECCGGYISLKDPSLAASMCDKITASAAGFQADCLVTACPLCKYNLNKAGKLPVIYFTELLAEALGVKEGNQ